MNAAPSGPFPAAGGVPQRPNLTDAVVCCGIPHIGRGDPTAFLRELGVVMGKVSGIRRLGAAALDLAYVAAGRLDGFWSGS